MIRYRPFGKTGLSFFPLGLGTIWFGRQWPPDNAEYQRPASKEIHEHLMLAYETMANKDGVVMIDTAAAYGDGELRIWDFFRRSLDCQSSCFI
jgi:aryl-alcohol dehydrogenase-like predicted oxidoreductase